MKKFHLIGLIFLLLSACSPQGTPPPLSTLTPVPTAQAMTSTPKPSVTEVTPAADSTSTTGTPTVCKDSVMIAKWTRDDVPYDYNDLYNNKPVPPNEHFTMAWTLLNNGTCTWDDTYALVFKSGYQMAQSASYHIVEEGKTLEPGQGTVVHIVMVAPPKTGGHQGVWQLQSRNGVLMKLNVFVLVDKGSYSAPARPLQLVYKTSCDNGFAKIRLSWVDAADNEDGYRIYRDSKMLVQLPYNTDTVLDAIPGGGGRHNYSVVAFNVAGEGSAELSAEVEKCKLTP